MVAILKPLAQGKSRTFRLGGCRLPPVSLRPSRHPSLPYPRLSRDRPPNPLGPDSGRPAFAPHFSEGFHSGQLPLPPNTPRSPPASPT